MADQYYDVYNQSQYNGGKPNEIKNTVGLVGFIMSTSIGFVLPEKGM